MKLVYLKNGQAAHLQEEIGDKFIVVKIMEVEDYEGNVMDIESDPIVVDCIFNNPPVDKIHNDILEAEEKKKEIIKSIEKQNSELYKLQVQINSTQKTIINNEKFIINKTDLINATSIAFFSSNGIMPNVLKKDNFKYGGFRGLKVSTTIEFDGKESSWGYTMYHKDEEYDSYYDHLCPKYGIVINPTEEQIDAIIKEKVSQIDLNEQYVFEKLNLVPKEYYTPEIISFMDERVKLNIENELTKSKRELESLQSKIKQQEEKIKELTNN